ncbi:protein phosphatase Slingshot homolog 3 isoform X2 [Cricetulus griseus]|uniref:protein-serine/threonine phosphatase n=1 Tax=Cricetulus griseus TaxID=10029 RepID=A0A9J7K6P4_CRIGR|nr:protein phosphatase Slingshot homolog 3 isoform X2 [Cricetulus griseus]XP_035316702.1 protein phosphatase Slingshot homolog 3 isoform X2 [Cricetulus griseus]
MALVTVSRSPPASGHSSPVGPTDRVVRRRGWLQRRQSFAVLRGAVLGLQDGGDGNDSAEADSEPMEEPLCEKQPTEDQTDNGQEFQSPWKQVQRQHLHLMVELLRPQDDIRLAAQLEAARPPRLRYLLVVSTGECLSQETILLGVDFPDSSSHSCTLGLVLPLWSDAQVYLDGDGGFSVTSGGQSRIFKPVSIQTMWATLQVLHQACEAALGSGLVPGGSALVWATHYMEKVNSDQGCLNEWMAMSDLESLRPPIAEPGQASEQEQMEQAILAELWQVLDTSDLESVTSKEIRQALELRLGCPLQQYRDFIDNQMLLLMAQQDRASRIFPHLYLGSEWNAANLEELQRNSPGDAALTCVKGLNSMAICPTKHTQWCRDEVSKTRGAGGHLPSRRGSCQPGHLFRVSHILNMAREIDNFFPERFTYHNVRVWDEESAQLLPHWKETHRFIERARAQGTRVLVHCKMGVSRSAATVLAYAMKQYGWGLEQALIHVQELRPIVRPNPGFLRQLQTYQGILTASRQSHVWEQKVGVVSPEEPLAPEVSTPLPPLPPEPGGSGEVMVIGSKESQEAPKEELGLRPRINLRGVMRSISLLEPSSEPERTPEAGDLPEVFSSHESSDEEPLHPFPQISTAKGGHSQRAHRGPWPALKSRQSVVALHSAALVASRTRAFQEQGQEQEQREAGMPSTPRLRKVVRQASVDDSREEGGA